MTNTAETNLKQVLSAAKKASAVLSNTDSKARSAALASMAVHLERNKEKILEANREDMERASKWVADGTISSSMFERLKLTENKLHGIVDGVRQVAALADPIGVQTLARELDSGLRLYRVTCPIGVVAVIFESRPDALPQIASLAIKSANAAVLKGGKEAQSTFAAIFECLTAGLENAGLPKESLTLLNTREDVEQLLSADGLIDLIIPRGSNQLVSHIQNNTRIPVLGHADGICHLYVHEDADLDMATRLAVDCKAQYPAACNSIETMLVHEKIAAKFFKKAVKELAAKNVELRCDDRSFTIIEHAYPQMVLKYATPDDWSTEYSDLILAVKVVDSLEAAIAHINEFGSNHTECIVTKDRGNFDSFFKSVNSAGVYWNASTRFADGFRYGFGAEVGISTGKLHPRGPVGVDGLVTYKYELVGDGHVVADYVGDDAKPFLHNDI